MLQLIQYNLLTDLCESTICGVVSIALAYADLRCEGCQRVLLTFHLRGIGKWGKMPGETVGLLDSLGYQRLHFNCKFCPHSCSHSDRRTSGWTGLGWSFRWQ